MRRRDLSSITTARLRTSWLSRPGCFADIQLHELGHVLGLDHSTTRAAIMYPSIEPSCSDRATGTRHRRRARGAGDLSARRHGAAGDRAGECRRHRRTARARSACRLTLCPAAGGSAQSAATSYRVYVGPSPTGPVLYSVTIASTSVTIAIPGRSLGGTFYVAVAGLNSAGVGPVSVPIAFTIPCDVPLSPSGLARRR